LVILAGSTRPTEELVLEQVSYLARLDGKIDAGERATIKLAKAFRAATGWTNVPMMRSLWLHH